MVDSRPRGVSVMAALPTLRDWRFPEREEPVRARQTITFQLTNKLAGDRRNATLTPGCRRFTG